MTEIQRTNVEVCNQIIAQLGASRPFNLKLDAGQTGSLYNIASESHHLHSDYVRKLTVTLWQRVNNGTGVILEINDSNADVLYHMLASYIAKHDLPEAVVQSLGEVL